MSNGPARPPGSSSQATSWSPGDLKRVNAALGAIATFALVAIGAIVVGCNAHELGHAAVGSALGWHVERVHLCLPLGGGVEYAQIGTWAGNAQGYAGGVVGAAIQVTVYLLVFERRAKPLRSAPWWAAGLGVVLWIGPQLLLAVLEGSADRGTDYTDAFTESPHVLIPLMIVATATGPAAFAWRWRVIWQRPSAR